MAFRADNLQAGLLIAALVLVWWPQAAFADLVVQVDISGESSFALDVVSYTATNYTYVLDANDSVVYEYDGNGQYQGIFIDLVADGATGGVFGITHDPFNDIFYILGNESGG